MVSTQIAVAFHGIGQPGRDLEPGEARYWISQDQFLSFLDLVAVSPDPARIVLTFDDGNASDYEIALPAMRERGLTGSFFPIAGRLDRPGSLGTAQLDDLAAAGMTVGSHGIAHVDWRKLDDQALEAELVGSKQILESRIGRPVTTASLPFGRYDARVLSALRRAGYGVVFSTDGGPSHPGEALVSRSNLRVEMTRNDFVNLVCGQDTLMGRFKRHLKALRRRFT